MRLPIFQMILSASVLLSCTMGARADEVSAIKAVEEAGGKLIFYDATKPRRITVLLDGCTRAEEVLGKLDTLAENVTRLQLSKSSITDKGLKLLANTPRLELLHLSDTSITDAGLLSLKGLSKLGILDLRNTKVTAEGVKVLSEYPFLYYLTLSGPAVTDDTLKRLASMGITTLKLADSNLITDAGIAHLYDSQNLRGITFSNCPVSPEAILGFKKKRIYSFGYTDQKMTAKHLAAIKDLRGVTGLDLSGIDLPFDNSEGFEQLVSLNFLRNKVTPACAKAIARLPKLQSLHLNNCDLGDEALGELANLKNLKVLDLTGTKVTDKGLPQLNNSKNISFLYLHNTAVTEVGARELKRHLDQTHIITRKQD